MKKSFAAITLVIAYLATVLAVAPPASAAIVGTVTVSATDVAAALPAGARNPWGPTTVDFQVSTPDDYQYTYYNYAVVVTAPDGAEAGRWTEQYNIASGKWQWSETLTAGNESFWDAYGTYSVTATVNFYGSAGNVPIDTKTATDTFTFSGPAIPPPPPPPAPPAPVTVQIDGKMFYASYSKYTRRFSAIVQSEYRTPAANETGTPVRWQLVVKGRLVRELSQSWSDTASLGAKLPRANRTKYVPVKLKENGVVVFKRSYKVKGRNA